MSDLLNFGLGAALISVFFIPFILRIYSDSRKDRTDFDSEIKRLNEKLEVEKDARRKDAEDFFKITTDQSKASNERNDALMVFLEKLVRNEK